MQQFIIFIALYFKQRNSNFKEIAKFDNTRKIENELNKLAILNCSFGAISHHMTQVSSEILNEEIVSPSISTQRSVLDVHSQPLITQTPDKIEIVNQILEVINTRSQSQHAEIQAEKRINNKMNRTHSLDDFSNDIYQSHVRDAVTASPSACTLVLHDNEVSSNPSSHGTNDLIEEQSSGNQRNERTILSDIPSNNTFDNVLTWLNGLIQSSENSAGLAGNNSVDSINIPSPNGERIKIKFGGQNDSIQLDTNTNEIQINISSYHRTVLLLQNHPIIEINCLHPTKNNK